MTGKSALSNRPLRPDAGDAALFVDRGGLVQRIERALAQDLNILVTGEPGSGRTTLLRHILWRNSRSAKSTRMAYVDGASVASVIGLVEEIRIELGRPRNVALTAGHAVLRGLANLRSGLDDSAVAIEYLRDLRNDAPATILLDGLPSTNVGRMLFGELRDELWNLPYAWILAGNARDKGTLLTPPSDAFWDVRHRLDPFTPAETRDLLRARLDDEALIEQLVLLGDGQPRRQISLAREAMLEGRSPGELQQHHEEDELRLQELGRAAYMLMYEIRDLGRPVSASDEELLRKIGWTRQRVARVLQTLESADFLESYTGSAQGQGRPPRLFRVPGSVVA